MKNMFKFLIIMFVVVSMVFSCFTLNIGAINEDSVKITVVFDDLTKFSEEQKQYIIKKFANNETKITENTIQPRAWCWLLGHKYVTENISVIEHEVHLNDPRCARKIYSVTLCSNCDYEESELISELRISCCQ